ncbi:1-phosphofructokinase family hexose kinase [Aldersonia kunmingensis]|uniref:1-phosphofructokinase family hexose kinase n=1 Tax=Aldersonia kunmingensis TaxID=408066 RepID=UPI00082F4708|nr:1-phosphofructokinase family hexose kinase [Aldersonia kunmingensis]
MIVTLTANPSIDRTVMLGGQLRRGEVHRIVASTSHPGGKGINVARAITASGVPVTAVLPGNAGDPLPNSLIEAEINHRLVACPGRARVNLAITEPDGTTTKINDLGPTLPADCRTAITEILREAAATASWLALSGSLPPGVPDDWYAELVATLRPLPARIAVDTSEAPLLALAAGFGTAAPDLIKPNAEELGQLTGLDGHALELAAHEGDPAPTARAARALIEQGGPAAILATLGSAGAVLATAEGAWYAASPPITPRSTVGAGDSSLAGYLIADLDGADPARRLAYAVAYGSAAAALPGTAVPSPHHTDPNAVTVTALSPTHL